MKKLCLLVLLSVLCSSCSRLFGPKKVECCEKTAACCYEQMCCLPRYALNAGLEPKTFTPEVPVYGVSQDLEPAPGEVVVKPTFFSRFNPFARSDDRPPQGQAQDGRSTQGSSSGPPKSKGIFGRWLWPF